MSENNDKLDAKKAAVTGSGSGGDGGKKWLMGASIALVAFLAMIVFGTKNANVICPVFCKITGVATAEFIYTNNARCRSLPG